MPGDNLSNEQFTQILSSLQTVVAQQGQILQGQQSMLARQQAQLDSMQDQLGMLTEVATKLAVMEERRAEDKTRMTVIEGRMDTVRDRVNEKFPQYDNLLEAYKSVNSRVWGAIGVALLGLIMGASKLGMLSH